jgi:SAM-dependent methyltransferase
MSDKYVHPRRREAELAGDQSWLPPGLVTSKVNAARVYDYWLGGTHNFRADQDVARALIAVEPNIRGVARANRAFLNRAVRFLAAQGIRQFIDIGSGIPTEQNVHQAAQDVAPGSRVVYADIDDVAVAHSRLLLEGNQDATIIHGDLREPDKILSDPETRALIDLSQPVGLLLVSVLHFLSDADEPFRVVATLRDALAPGSYLVLSHGTRESRPEVGQAFETVYNKRVTSQASVRPREEILEFFDGFRLVEPGLVYTPEWRPDSPDDVPADARNFWLLAGVGVREGTA